MPAGAFDCGNGHHCFPGNKCTGNGGCIPEANTDCGTYNCSPGFKCSSGGCIADDAVDCGNGRYCNAGHVCVQDKCISQAALDEQRRQKEEELENARERARLAKEQADRLQSLAAAARRLQEEKQQALRSLRRWIDECRHYIASSCNSARVSPDIEDTDRENVIAWHEEAVKLETDKKSCEAGSSSACDAALSSPALLSNWEREKLIQLRTEASFWNRTLSSISTFLSAALFELKSLPLSTVIAGGFALAFGLALIVLLLRTRRTTSSSRRERLDPLFTSGVQDAKASSLGDPAGLGSALAVVSSVGGTGKYGSTEPEFPGIKESGDRQEPKSEVLDLGTQGSAVFVDTPKEKYEESRQEAKQEQHSGQNDSQTKKS